MEDDNDNDKLITTESFKAGETEVPSPSNKKK